MALTTSLHFTPDGVSQTRPVITINIALLTEGGSVSLDVYKHLPPDGGKFYALP